ncbi:unnamed protein product, partial [marine sediment metagenome]
SPRRAILHSKTGVADQETDKGLLLWLLESGALASVPFYLRSACI